MSEEITKNKITIDDKEYFFEDMTPKQQVFVNHIVDLNRKINSAQFNLDQLMVGRNAMTELLKQELNEEVDDKAA